MLPRQRESVRSSPNVLTLIRKRELLREIAEDTKAAPEARIAAMPADGKHAGDLAKETKEVELSWKPRGGDCECAGCGN